ncbi:G5 domain-containing protein [Georgenia sp. H159]|uniref:aggregation-promoting factor C-terminal-like domain-containing protein n=1 Tax=Georgenia sp. H159 TaxID=3076115 RepID=UPI002D77B404|nr:G5 domain-containing protein [Georgenia sp. H159]
MPEPLRRARHRDVAERPRTLRTVARRGVHTLVLAVIAGGTVAFAGVAGPDATPQVAADTAATSDVVAIDRAEAGLIASRFESRAPVPGAAVELVVDGEARELTTGAASVAELLTEAGVLVDQDDVVSTPMTAPVVAGMTVEVATVDTIDKHVTETDEHATVEEEDDSLPRGERRVVTEGVDGVTATTFRITTSGGEETAREVVARAVVSERVDEVVRVGTAEPVAPPPAPSSPSPSGPSSTAPAAPAAPAPTGNPKAIAADMVAARGWGSDQFSCLDVLWERESNWNPTAQNPSSGAYGIPQSLPGSKMASVASDWRTNPATQITWGLNYISGRYGTPCGALAHSNAVNWY